MKSSKFINFLLTDCHFFLSKYLPFFIPNQVRYEKSKQLLFKDSEARIEGNKGSNNG